MTIKTLLLSGAAGAILLAGTAQAQNSAPESLLPAAKAQPAKPAPAKQQSVDEAFGDIRMESGEVVQEVPSLEGIWSVEQVEALLAYIPTVAAEGLNPADYRAADLSELLTVKGPGGEVNRMASEIFVWLVEDLRDGRTPMESRRQWFVVDPDADRLPTWKLLEEALASGDIAGTLDSLDPVHPDYDRLRTELASAKDPAKRKLIRANMDRWRWLPQDLGKQYLLTNVPEYKLRLTVNGRIIKSYRTIVGKPGRTATPQLAESVEGVIFNPTWTVPQSIVKGEGLGARVLGNPAWAKRNGYLTTSDFGDWLTEDGLHKSVISRPGLTAQDLVVWCDRARREFYLRPSYIWSKVRQVITQPREARRVLKSFRTFVRYLVRPSLKAETNV